MSVNFSAITPLNPPVNTRLLIDFNYVTNVALPATATTANTNALNLLNATPYPTTETINVGVNTTASVNGNSVTGNVYLQHTTDNGNNGPNTSAWANIPTLGNSQITQGASSTAATTNTYKLPPGCQQWIRAQVSLPANTASLADATLTLELIF